jgi:hypothetical protein
MTTNALHVVFGTGPVGGALVEHLTGLGVEVRAVSRNRPVGLSRDIDWRSADAADPESATDAAKGATVVYQCLNASYTAWPTLFPPLQHGVLTAAERTGSLLVSFENIYGYGPVGGRPMTEDLPLSATTVKGRTRAAMTHDQLSASAAGRVRIAIGRAADLFGAGVTESSLGRQFFPNAAAGKKVDFIGNPDLLHTAIVFAVPVFVVAEIAAVPSFFLGSAILHSRVSVSAMDPGVLRVIIGVGLYIAMLGVCAITIGTLVSHTAGAIIGIIGFVLVLSPLALLLPGTVGPHIRAYLPTVAGHQIATTVQAPDQLLGPRQGFGVFSFSTIALMLVASFALNHRDA